LRLKFRLRKKLAGDVHIISISFVRRQGSMTRRTEFGFFTDYPLLRKKLSDEGFG
jgi:hypothetical protein